MIYLDLKTETHVRSTTAVFAMDKTWSTYEVTADHISPAGESKVGQRESWCSK